MENGPADAGSIARLTALADRQQAEIAQLRDAAPARALVDLARGVLMERLGCSPSEAGAQLGRIAAEAGSTPAELAAQLVGLPPAPEGAGQQPPARLAAAATDTAPDADRLAAALLAEALADAGAVAVAIWLTAPDGAIELAGQAGFPAMAASSWRRVPPGLGVLAERAARSAADDEGATWWPAGRPADNVVPLLGPWQAGARAVLPIREAWMTLGALEVCWPDAISEFGPPLRRQLHALADLCGRTLGSGQRTDGGGAEEQGGWILGVIEGLAGSVLVASAVRNCAGTVTDFRLGYVSPGFADPAGREASELTGQSLLAAYPGAALPGGLFDTAVTALETGQPQRVSDVAIAAQPAGRVTARITRLFDGVAVCLRSASEPGRLATLLDRAQRLGRIGGWEEVLATGAVYWTEAAFALFGVASPIRLAGLDDHVPADDIPAVAAFRHRLLHDIAPAAAAFRIIRTDDGSVRQIRAFAEPVLDAARQPVAILGAYQDVSARYHTEVALAVTRGQLTETEQRAEEEHRLALRLQEAITPHASRLLEAGDLAVAARYRSASEGHLVSGDWYDAVPLPTGQVLLVVGDIAGHGIDAVTGMVTLRNSLRGLALTGAGPAQLLALLNGVCNELTDDVLGTAICALYDPASRQLRSAKAGHLPMILVRSGSARLLTQPNGLLLGASADVSYDEATTALEVGDTLLLYTDGLIERRNKPIDDCLDALVTIASRPVTDVDAYADLLAAEASSDTGDDACLLAISVR